MQVVCDQHPLVRDPVEGSGRANKPPADEFFAYAPDSLDMATKTIRKNMMGVVVGTMLVRPATTRCPMQIMVGMFPQPGGEMALKPAWSFADEDWSSGYDALRLSIFAEGRSRARSFRFKPLKTTDSLDLNVLHVTCRNFREPDEGDIALRWACYSIYATQGGWPGVKAAARRITMAREAGEWVLQDSNVMVSREMYGIARQLADWSEV